MLFYSFVRVSTEDVYLLKFISLELTGNHDLDALLQLVQHNQWYPKFDGQRITFNTVELAMVHTFQSIWKEVNNPVVTPPNCKGSLLHWRILAEIISKFPSEVQHRISRLDTCSPEHIEPNMRLSDAHFHLDQMCKMFHTQDFKALEHNITSGTNLPVLHTTIINFVFPSSWDNISLEDPQLFYTIGLLPHLVGTINNNPSFFIEHLQHPRCIGIGEIGLDYTTRCKCYPNHHSLSKESCIKEKIQQQHRFLCALLPQIPAATPVVIHTNGQNAVNDMIRLLIEFKEIQQPIHWH